MKVISVEMECAVPHRQSPVSIGFATRNASRIHFQLSGEGKMRMNSQFFAVNSDVFAKSLLFLLEF